MTQDEFIDQLKQRHHYYIVNETFAQDYYKENIETIEPGPVTFKNENEFRQLARLSKISNESALDVLELLDEYFRQNQQ